ncbi:MAG: hypothetical protein U5N56_08010 [Candidatus Marinimicrobia bacterium]|nr:hypothetical protein [Candidatus Neomarinimicrobiota bacterium]
MTKTTYISPTINFKKSNTVVILFNGHYSIINDKKIEYKFEGKISLEWFPQIHIKIVGKNSVQNQECSFIDLKNKFKIMVNGSVIGIANLKSCSDPIGDFEGVLHEFHLGENTAVDRIRFTLINFTKLIGNERYSHRGFYGLRTVLKFDNYQIILNPILNKYPNRRDSLEDEGGYFSNISGSISKIDNSKVSLKESQNIFECFSYYLSFINGSWCAPIYYRGMQGNRIAFNNISEVQKIAPYKNHIGTWAKMSKFDPNIVHLSNELWNSFNSIWVKDDYFVKLAIHWYIESISHYSSSLDHIITNSIITAQTGMELFYNWLYENQIINKSENAESRIRSIIQKIGINENSIFKSEGLINFISTTKELESKNLIGAMVYIRNGLIHPKNSKRKNIKTLDKNIIVETSRIWSWIIELTLLFIFEYNGKYCNRLEGGKVCDVPWK